VFSPKIKRFGHPNFWAGYGTEFHRAVVPKLVRAVTQIKVAIMSYSPQYFPSKKEPNQ